MVKWLKMNSELQKTVFFAFDKSGSVHFKEPDINNTEEWVTLVGVLTEDVGTAEIAWKKIKNIKNYEEAFQILAKFPLEFFLLSFNIYNAPIGFAKIYKKVKFSDSEENLDYKPIGKFYTLHSWLIVDYLREKKIKANVQVIHDGELEGYILRQYLQEIGSHVKNIGGNLLVPKKYKTYPLHRIADKISNDYWTSLSRDKNKIIKAFDVLSDKIHLMHLQISLTENEQGEPIYRFDMATFNKKRTFENFTISGVNNIVLKNLGANLSGAIIQQNEAAP